MRRAPRRGRPLGTAENNRIVKSTYEKEFPGNRVCKKTVRETCDVQEHTMKCQLPGILCVKNNTRRGPEYVRHAIGGVGRAVLILSNGKDGNVGGGDRKRGATTRWVGRARGIRRGGRSVGRRLGRWVVLCLSLVRTCAFEARKGRCHPGAEKEKVESRITPLAIRWPRNAMGQLVCA